MIKVHDLSIDDVIWYADCGFYEFSPTYFKGVVVSLTNTYVFIRPIWVEGVSEEGDESKFFIERYVDFKNLFKSELEALNYINNVSLDAVNEINTSMVDIRSRIATLTA